MTPAKLYLTILAIIYLGFAAWCTLQPRTTAASLGYTLSEPSGRCEFLVVYGGLELGLGLIFALAAYRSSMELPVLWMAFVMHAALALYRVIIILTASGFATVIFAVFGLELALAIAGACLALPRGLP